MSYALKSRVKTLRSGKLIKFWIMKPYLYFQIFVKIRFLSPNKFSVYFSPTCHCSALLLLTFHCFHWLLSASHYYFIISSVQEWVDYIWPGRGRSSACLAYICFVITSPGTQPQTETQVEKVSTLSLVKRDTALFLRDFRQGASNWIHSFLDSSRASASSSTAAENTHAVTGIPLPVCVSVYVCFCVCVCVCGSMCSAV